AASFSNSSHFPPSELNKFANPVILPSGRAMFRTRASITPPILPTTLRLLQHLLHRRVLQVGRVDSLTTTFLSHSHQCANMARQLFLPSLETPRRRHNVSF